MVSSSFLISTISSSCCCCCCSCCFCCCCCCCCPSSPPSLLVVILSSSSSLSLNKSSKSTLDDKRDIDVRTPMPLLLDLYFPKVSLRFRLIRFAWFTRCIAFIFSSKRLLGFKNSLSLLLLSK